MADISAELDPDELTLRLTVKGDVKPAAAYKRIDSDFFCHTVSGERVPGPFADLTTSQGLRKIDSR
jgi:hypothetical protein